jgi:flagellar P-ring protein precursor FlgI
MDSKMLGMKIVTTRTAMAFLGCCAFAWVAPLCHGQASTDSPESLAPLQALEQPKAQPIKRSVSANLIRVKDITRLSSDRTNTLEGRGLVTGLGTGGSNSEDTAQALRNYYKRWGLNVQEVAEGGVALVNISVDVPANCEEGESLIGTVSVLDEATSLFGGTLQSALLYPIGSEDAYAVASGQLVVGGFSAKGDGANITKNHPTKAKVTVQIERRLQNESPFSGKTFDLLLLNDDRGTAVAIEEAINAVFPKAAQGLHGGVVQVCYPPEFENNKLKFVNQIEQLKVTTDSQAIVIVNESTGAIVIGENVKLSTFAFGYEDLVVTVRENPDVYLPLPFTKVKDPVVTPNTVINVTESGGNYALMEEQPTIRDLATLLNQLGVPPRDLIPILIQARDIKALQAQLIIE